jgi:UDP-N-acetylglucosamine--N-acetylmuramyl-(pentapeptide) pyrophosphoryl-undecaprenol N-acetylglucosamine transferase
MRILFVGGGSVGHLAPCVAVLRTLQGHGEVLAHFLCTEREEDRRYLEAEGIACTQLPLLRASLTLPFRYARARRIAGRAFDAFRPDVVFCKGGAIGIPVCLEARRREIPIVLHESDAVMGRANRWLSKIADVVCLGFPEQQARSTKHEARFVVTGNPVRPEVTRGTREEGLRITRLSGMRPILLVIGGSQGAEALNAAVREHIDELLAVCDIIHLTGKGKEGAASRPGYWSVAFAHEELPHLYAIASLAVSRAGAGSISELAANGIPAILVPIRGLAQDHQVANAERLARSGGARILAQEELGMLPQTVRSLIGDRALLATMSQQMRSLAASDAASRITGVIARVCRQKNRQIVQNVS